MISYTGLAKAGGQDESMNQDFDMQWKVSAGALNYAPRISEPESLHNQVTCHFHNNPESGHLRALRTAELISREFYWLGLDTTVWKCIASSNLCHQIEAPRHSQCGANILLPPLYNPWGRISMDFITDLPESTQWEYTAILAKIARLPKMAIYLTCWNEILSPQMEHMCVEHMISNHGIPKNILMDRAMQITRPFGSRVCSHMSIEHQLSSTYHRETNCQTERHSQAMEQHLRAFCNYEQGNWAKLLPLAEFVYNDSVHASTRMTLFWAIYHQNLKMQLKPPKASHL